ncbi:rihA, partial [Symbiodinium necroappetens]
MTVAWWLPSLAVIQQVCCADVGKARLVISPDGGWHQPAAANGDSLLRSESVEHEDARAEENWKLVLKAGKTSKLGFSSPLWTNSDLLNKDSAEDKAEDAKYEAFNTVPFKKIRMCVDEPKDNCVEHELKKEYDNAKALFSGKYIKDTKVDQKGILKAFKVKKGTYQDCPMQRPGFNIECNGGNKARWGYCNNCASQACQNNDNDDADGAIGIGIAGQSTTGELGAGWTAYFASPGGQCRANGKTHKA